MTILLTLNRNGPTGGFAYGMPWKLIKLIDSQLSRCRPRTGPLLVCTRMVLSPIVVAAIIVSDIF